MGISFYHYVDMWVSHWKLHLLTSFEGCLNSDEVIIMDCEQLCVILCFPFLVHRWLIKHESAEFAK